MNSQQTNYLLSSFLQYSVCSNEGCPMWLSTFAISDYSRCPICNEPALLPQVLAPVLRSKKSKNILERYLPDYIRDTLRENKLFRIGNDIGNTPLSISKSISKWTGIDNLYLKEEYKNPSGSFKDRGTLTAIALLQEKLFRDNTSYNTFVLGTVSTGNMAISTAFMVNKVNNLAHYNLNSFVIVNANTSEKKLQAIEKAAGTTGTTIFIVEGNYAEFHEQVYEVCKQLRHKGISIYPELTDDIFRIIGYASLFGEIIDQLEHNKRDPDAIILPVASGALFRVAVWALESLYKKRYIQKIPQVILVQEIGADPIVQAFQKKLQYVKPIRMPKNVLADGIDVSYSRSGNPALRILEDRYHICINVSGEEIQEAYQELSQQRFYAEEASAASIAAAKKLRAQDIISKNSHVVCVLTGGNISKRTLGNNVGISKRIFCTLNELRETLIKIYGTNHQQVNTQNVYFF